MRLYAYLHYNFLSLSNAGKTLSFKNARRGGLYLLVNFCCNAALKLKLGYYIHYLSQVDKIGQYHNLFCIYDIIL